MKHKINRHNQKNIDHCASGQKGKGATFAITTAILCLSACTSLSNGARQAQPVELIDTKTKTWFTTCSGAVEEWNSCQNKALNTCPSGFEALKKIESPVGGRRELTFICK